MSTNDQIELKQCQFCGGAADVTDLGVTSFIIDQDGAIIGEILCGSCATSVTCADDMFNQCEIIRDTPGENKCS